MTFEAFYTLLADYAANTGRALEDLNADELARLMEAAQKLYYATVREFERRVDNP